MAHSLSLDLDFIYQATLHGWFGPPFGSVEPARVRQIIARGILRKLIEDKCVLFARLNRRDLGWTAVGDEAHIR